MGSSRIYAAEILFVPRICLDMFRLKQHSSRLLALLFVGLLTGCSGPATIQESARLDDTSSLTRQLNAGANINARDYAGYTALHWAAYADHLDAARILVQHGANLEAIENGGLTPLEVAACYFHPDIAQFLLEKGANVNAKDRNGWTPLDYAASNDDVPMAELLIDFGASTRAVDYSGRTALIIAHDYRARDVENMLLDPTLVRVPPLRTVLVP